MKKIRNLTIIVLVFMTSSCVYTNVDLGSMFQGGDPLSEVTVKEGGVNKVLVIDLEGVISGQSEDDGFLRNRLSSTSWVRQNLDKAANDDRIKAIILEIESPGGDVTASDIIYNDLMRFREETAIPVIVLMKNLATSGGYYVAAAADNIVALPTTITGSVGVIFMGFSIEGLMHKVGVKSQPVISGDKKDIGSPFRDMSEDEKELIQGIVNQHFERFMDIIKKGRPQMSPSDLKVVSDARILTAKQALELHMVDQIGYFSDALSNAARLGKISGIPRVVKYQRPYEYIGDIYSHSNQANASVKNVFGLNPRRADFIPKAAFMYIWIPPAD